jgi:predicted ATPase
MGLEFEWEALAELAPDGRRPSGAQLAALVRKGLIRPHQATADTFRFRHTLIRDAAYDRVSKERRSDLHERAASWLDGRGEEFEEIIGYHLEQAYRCVAELGPPGDRGQRLAEQAAERLAASGRRAHARADTHAAVNLLERAGGLLPPYSERRLGLLPSLGRALTESGQLQRADSVLSEAVENAGAAGQELVATDAAVALSYLRAHTVPELSDEEVRRELEGVIPVLERLGDEASLARALSLAGMLSFWRGETAAAVADLERAAGFARQAGDRPQEAESLQYLLMAILWGPTTVDEALERVEEIRAGAGPNERLEVTLLRTDAQLQAMRGRFETARDLLTAAKALADELGLKIILAAGVAQQAGYIELLSGDAAAAERVLRPACETLEQMGDWGHYATLAPRLADALFMQGGADEEALRLTEVAERSATPGVADEDVGWRRVRAKLLARKGDREEAERFARQATALAAMTDLLDDRAQTLADLAEVLRLGGRPEESTAALEEALRLYEQKGNVVATARLRAVLVT